MKSFITVSLTALFTLADIFAGNLGLFPAFSGFCAIVITLAYGYRAGIASALLSGMVLDALYARPFSLLPLIYTLVLVAVTLLADRGHRQYLPICAGGILAGLGFSGGTLLITKLFGGTLPGPDIGSFIIFSAGSGGILLAVLVWGFDCLADKANLPRCIKPAYAPSGRHKRTVSRSKLAGSRKRSGT